MSVKLVRGPISFGKAVVEFQDMIRQGETKNIYPVEGKGGLFVDKKATTIIRLTSITVFTVKDYYLLNVFIGARHQFVNLGSISCEMFSPLTTANLIKMDPLRTGEILRAAIRNEGKDRLFIMRMEGGYVLK